MKHIYCTLVFCMTFFTSYTQSKQEKVSHYIFPEFTKGVILMNDGTKYEALLNYNSLTEEMIFLDQGIKMAIEKNDVNIIDSVFISDRKFIVFKGNFVELLHSSSWELYAGYKCGLKDLGKPIGYGSRSKTLSVKSYTSLNAEGVTYDLKLPDSYELKPVTHYWLLKNGETYSFRNRMELRKLYKEEKDLFKAYIKEFHIKYDNKEGLIQLIEYLESN